jgi:XTP/dITP diphosphohydrolase
MKTIYFVTSNKGKLLEAKEKLSAVAIEVVQRDIGYPEPQVDTLEEVARFGVDDVQKRLNQPFFLEDAGLFIDSLSGFPGVYSSYVFRTIGCEGVLKLLENIDERKAVFKSVIAYKEPEADPMIFVGECRGRIFTKELGGNGFGFDPIFIPDGQTKTFAQMDIKGKNRFSHRSKSLEKLIDFFKKQ